MEKLKEKGIFYMQVKEDDLAKSRVSGPFEIRIPGKRFYRERILHDTDGGFDQDNIYPYFAIKIRHGYKKTAPEVLRAITSIEVVDSTYEPRYSYEEPVVKDFIIKTDIIMSDNGIKKMNN